MSWNERLKAASAGIALTLVCAAGAASAAGAAPLVVKSSGPSAAAFPPGKAIGGTAKIALKAGDTIVILDGRGTRTLKGPGIFNPSVASTQLAADSRDTFPEVAQRNERARIGAVRGGAGLTDAHRNPNIWFVDVGRSSTVCVTDPSRVTMWRGGSDDAAVATLTAMDGKTAQVIWGKDQALKSWPAELPVTNGAQYKLTWAGMPAATTLRFSVLGPNPTGIEDMASTLIKNGCQAQLDLLIETVSIPGQSAAPAG